MHPTKPECRGAKPAYIAAPMQRYASRGHAPNGRKAARWFAAVRSPAPLERLGAVT